MQVGSHNSGGIDSGLQEANYIASVLAPRAMGMVTTITTIFIIVLGWASIILEVFQRHSFGERYLSAFRIFFASSIMVLWLYPGILIALGTGRRASPFFVVFVLGFIIMCLWHRLRIRQRNRQRIPWHSMSFGISYLESLNLPFAGKDDWTLYKWVEPALWGVIFLIVRQIDPISGSLIGFATFALLIKNHLVYFQMRSRILDLIDARIEGMYYNAEAYDKPKTEVAGVSVVQAVWPVLPETPSDMDKTVRETLGTARTVPKSNAAVAVVNGDDPTVH